MLATLASTQVPAATDTVRHALSSRSPRARVDEMVQVDVAATPPPNGGPRSRHATAGHGDGLTARVDLVGVIVGDQHGPATGWRRTGDGHVAADADHDTGASGGDRRSHGAVDGQGLGRGAEIELDAGRDPDLARPVVELDVSPWGRARDVDVQRRAVGHDQVEVAVIAQGLHRATKRRIDPTAGQRSGPQRDPQRLDQRGRHRHALARSGVQRDQLRIRSKARARGVDSVDHGHGGVDRRHHRVAARGQDDSVASERTEAGPVSGHDAPEETRLWREVGAGTCGGRAQRRRADSPVGGDVRCGAASGVEVGPRTDRCRRDAGRWGGAGRRHRRRRVGVGEHAGDGARRDHRATGEPSGEPADASQTPGSSSTRIHVRIVDAITTPTIREEGQVSAKNHRHVPTRPAGNVPERGHRVRTTGRGS